MNYFDWQAYDDGSMDAATRAMADKALAESESARSQLQHFRTFREELRNAALSEPVPVQRLSVCLTVAIRQAQPARRRRMFYWSGGLATAACLIVAMVVFANTPRINEVGSPPVATAKTMHEPRAIRNWLADETGLPVPEIKLAGLDARMEGASHGRDWVAWEVTLCGQDYTIYGRQDQHWFDHATMIEQGMKPMFVDGKHIGWYCAMGMAYVIKGGTPEGRLQLAKIACQETPSAVKLSQAPAERS